MFLSMCMIAIAAFLSGGVAAVFVMLVIGIRKSDRVRHLYDAPDTPLDALTRSILGAGAHHDCPADRSDYEED